MVSEAQDVGLVSGFQGFDLESDRIQDLYHMNESGFQGTGLASDGVEGAYHRCGPDFQGAGLAWGSGLWPGLQW